MSDSMHNSRPNVNELIVHLSEMRKRIIWIAAWFIASMAVGMYVSPHILLYIKSQPAAVNLVWNVFSLTDGLFVYMRCAFLIALLVTVPVLLYQVWSFVRPGLTDAEARGALLYVPISFLLFLGGMLFSYFIVFPMMVGFMEQMNRSVGAVATYGIDRYFSFMFSIVFPLAIAFEMPLAALFLTRLGLLNPDKMKKTRKFAYVVLAVVGACISPPDFVSHLSVTIPLLMLFEISAALSGRYYRKLSAMPAQPSQ